jgi:AcrR family transcriptional regulator
MNAPLKPHRVTANLRRELILSAARRCFARYGFAGTTTKSVAAAAEVSEGLLYKHFPSKSALYAAILAESCETDPRLRWLLDLEPSTATLVTLMHEMVGHYLGVVHAPDRDEAQRVRLTVSSHLGDGEFARLLYDEIGRSVGPLFVASLDHAIAAGDAVRLGATPLNLFWFAHHAVHMVTLTSLPPTPTLSYGEARRLARQLTEFILRGVGLTDAAIALHLAAASRHQVLRAEESA